MVKPMERANWIWLWGLFVENLGQGYMGKIQEVALHFG